MANISQRRFLHTPRDTEMYRALELGPMTGQQLLALSETWHEPFTSLRRVLDRLRILGDAGRVRQCWYARAARGGGSAYYQLTHRGYRLLYGDETIQPPTKHFFTEVPVSLHHHKHTLMDVIVHSLVSAHRHGVQLLTFSAENELKLCVGNDHVCPDASLSFRTLSNRTFRFHCEVDMSTITLRSNRSQATIERRLLLYDLHRQAAGEPYVVPFFTKTRERRDHILGEAACVVSNPRRLLFIGATVDDFLKSENPLTDPCFLDHLRRPVPLIPLQHTAKPEPRPFPVRSFVPSCTAC